MLPFPHLEVESDEEFAGDGESDDERLLASLPKAFCKGFQGRVVLHEVEHDAGEDPANRG